MPLQIEKCAPYVLHVSTMAVGKRTGYMYAYPFRSSRFESNASTDSWSQLVSFSTSVCKPGEQNGTTRRASPRMTPESIAGFKSVEYSPFVLPRVRLPFRPTAIPSGDGDVFTTRCSISSSFCYRWKQCLEYVDEISKIFYSVSMIDGDVVFA